METYLSAEMYEGSHQVRVGQNTNQRQYTNYHWFFWDITLNCYRGN